VERFAALCDRAADIGAEVQLEFMPFTAVKDLAAAWEVVGAADRPNGGLVIDTWHFFRSGSDIAVLADIPGDRVFSVQVSDAPAEPSAPLVEETFNRLLPGEGDLDLTGLLAALDRTGALRWVGPEVLSPVTAAMAPTEAARLAGRHVRELVSRVRSAAPG
jgi:sugar phosphate isomerase/epimerase